MKIRSTSIRSRFQAGFSLAEVTLATGIMALALTTLLGLIPQGLTNLRQAGNLAVESRIVDHIIGSVAQSKWQDVSGGDYLSLTFDHRRYYFDDQGIAIESDKPGTALAYVAELYVPPRDVSLPSSGTATATDNDPYLRRVTIKVTSVANERFDFDRALPVAYRSLTTLIARTGK